MERGGRLAAEIPARLTPVEGRRFAFSVGTAFLFLGGIAWWRDHHTTLAFLSGLGGGLLLAGLLAPGRLGPVYRGWMRFGLALSKITTPILMGIVFFLVIAPIGLVMRLFGRNPVSRRELGGSYWVAREPRSARRSDLSRQF
jgi:hypothetical protein